ncbi:unnamed protein product [Candida verbasci]|uniref:Alpha-factor-transporting ATPase n=1 Tax=Candida verbasci TaxID=1227364 RepID=A0A9W4XA93_9ASCO|nr:unnamed protein product [Candida verbasci]
MDEKKSNYLDDIEEVDIEITTGINVFMFLNWKQDWLIITCGIILMTTSAVCTPLNTLLYGKIFATLSDYYLNKFTNYDLFIKEILKLCGIIMALGCGKLILTFLGNSIWIKFGEIQQSRARTKIYTKLLNQQISWFDTNENIIGNLTQINRCIEEYRSGNGEVLASITQTIGLVISLIIMSFYQSWAITLIIMAPGPIMAGSAWYFGKLTYKYQSNENDLSSKASKILDWSLTSPMIIRIFNGKYLEIANFNKLINSSAIEFFKMSNAICLNMSILKFLSLLMFVQGFWFGNFLLIHHHVSINQLFTCFSSCLMLGDSISKISELMAILNTAHAAACKIATFLDNVDDEVKINLLYPTGCLGTIKFKNVVFSYPSRNQIILNKISFEIKQNKFNYIIGKSGCGKSTIPLLIMNLYKIQSGTIEIDNYNLNTLDSNWIYETITLIQQNPTIFNDSVKNNIAYSVINEYELDEIPDQMILQAMEFAMIDKDLNSKINQSSLSGGQQQRISIARAYLKNSPILILDEAFSALDYNNKQILYEKIKFWRRGKTTIIITHEFNNIDDDDHVIMLDQGVKYEGDFANIKNDEFIKISEKETTEEKEIIPVSSKEELFEEEPTIMGVFAILNYCKNTIDKKFIILIAIFISILEGVANPIFSFCFSKLLSTTMNASIGKDINSVIIKWSCISLSIAFSIGVTNYISHFLLAYSSESWIIQLRKLSFDKICHTDLKAFNGLKPAEVTTLLMNDTRDLRGLISQFLSLSVNLVSMVLVGIIWSIVSGWKLALVGISFVPLVMLLTIVYGILLENAENNYKSRVVDLEIHQHQTITTLKTIKLFNMNKFFETQFNNHLKEIRKVGNIRALHAGLSMGINDFITSLATGIILYYGMQLTGKYQYSHDQLLRTITLLTFTISNASSLIHQLPEIARGQRAGTYIVKLLNEVQESKVENDGIIIPKHINDPIIEFKNVNFSYENNQVLNSVTFSVNKNEMVGIIGESGCGKSTIVSVILRLYESENVYLFNQNINDLNIDWLRESISIVPQFPKFFDGSIFENLIYGINTIRRISINEIYDNLKKVGIYEFVIGLAEGLQTNIGEGNSSLISGGQLQRLSIARALLRRPKILIFDECTSNLDPISTTLIFDLIESFRGKLTILFITHDKEMMKLSDRNLIIKNGKLISQYIYNL